MNRSGILYPFFSNPDTWLAFLAAMLVLVLCVSVARRHSRAPNYDGDMVAALCTFVASLVVYPIAGFSAVFVLYTIGSLY